MLHARLGSEDIENDHLTSLLKAIVTRSSDVEIWKLVLQYVDSVDPSKSRKPTTSPTSLPSFQGTPRTSNSGSHDGFEETKDVLENGLREEFKDCSYTHTEGIIEKYFEGESWSTKALTPRLLLRPSFSFLCYFGDDGR